MIDKIKGMFSADRNNNFSKINDRSGISLGFDDDDED